MGHRSLAKGQSKDTSKDGGINYFQQQRASQYLYTLAGVKGRGKLFITWAEDDGKWLVRKRKESGGMGG